MGPGWRRAFCTTIPRERDSGSDDKEQIISPSPRNRGKLGFPSTPRSLSVSRPTFYSSIETPLADESPKELLRCRTTTATSPRSPLKLSLFRNSFKFRSSCGICLSSVKTGQGTAIYTAECSHAFHFPCIADHFRKQNAVVCPVCSTTWKDVPLLAANTNANDAVLGETAPQPKMEEKRVIESKPTVSRAYDDDEPLFTPRFKPIPEADEEDEDDQNDAVEEFRGFFVNPDPSFAVESDAIPSNGRDFRSVRVSVLPESAVVSVSRGYETYAVELQVKAPAASSNKKTASLLDPASRAPVDLVTVLDVSATMAGSKLQMLKRAMRLVISSLGSADRLSIVAFSSSPKRLLPLKRMTVQGQRAAHRVVDRLACGQGSSVGDALRKATKVLQDRREKNPVASIILLSDGQDGREKTSREIQRQESSHASSTRFAHIEIPVHASGFGESGGYSREPAEDVFAKCVGKLLSVVVQDLRIQLNVASGSSPCEISAVYLCGGNPTVVNNSGSIRLGDLYAGEERELLAEVRVPAVSAVGSHHVVSVRCLYKDPVTQEIVYGRDQSLLVPRPSPVRSSAPKIERLRDRFVATRAVAESRRLVESSDFNSAFHLLASARALLMQSGSASANQYFRTVEAELAEIQWRRQQVIENRDEQMMVIRRRRASESEIVFGGGYESDQELTPASAWRAAEKLAKLAMLKKSLSKVSDLHGFENARF